MISVTDNLKLNSSNRIPKKMYTKWLGDFDIDHMLKVAPFFQIVFYKQGELSFKIVNGIL